MNEDLISREALKKFINEVCFSEEWVKFRVDNGSRGQIERILTYIDNAPTVSAYTFEEVEEIRQATIELVRANCKNDRPQGEWSDESKDSLLCSACGKRIYKPFIGGFPTERTSHYYPNFCAFCGADMRGGRE